MPLENTLLTDDVAAPATGDTGDAAAKAAADKATADATAAAAAAPVSADDQRKALIDAGGNADEIGKLDEAALKTKYTEHKTAADAKAAAGAPEKYEPFKAADGVQVDAELAKEFEGVARELNLPQDKAQKVFDMGTKLATGFSSKLSAAVEKQVTQWAEQSRGDKEIGGEAFDANLAIAKAGLKDATPELRKLFKESGLGNHPEVIRHFFRLGKLLQQDKTMQRGDGNKPSAQSFYTNSQMNP